MKLEAVKRKMDISDDESSTINPKDLTIDPLPCISSQEPNNLGHIVGLTQAAERASFRDPVNCFLTFPGEEEFGGDRARSNTVGSDPATLELLGDYFGHGFHSGLGSSIGGVTRHQSPNDGGGDHDDSSTGAACESVGGLSANQECSFGVDVEYR